MKKNFKSFIVLPEIIFMIIAALCGFLFLFYIQLGEFFFLDLQFLLAHSIPSGNAVSPEIALVLLDDNSKNRLYISPSWFSLREHHSKIVEILARAGARLVVFNVEFITPDERWDHLFAEKCRKAGNVIAIEKGGRRIVEEIRKNLLYTGEPHIMSYWGVPRLIPYEPDRENQPALSIITTFHYLQTLPRKNGKGAEPVSPLQNFWINYKESPSFFPLFSYIDILETSGGQINDRQKTPLSFFKDKIVFIDYSTDEFPIPDLTGRKLPGVYAQAYSVHNLINSTPLNPAYVVSSIILIISVLLIQLFLFIKKWLIKATCLLLFFLSIFVLDFIFFLVFNFWLAYTPVLASGILLIILNQLYKKRIFQKEYKVLTLQVGQLQGLLDKVRDTEERKETFVANLIHDIKNCAVSIDTGIKLLYLKYDQIPGIDKNLNFIRTACTDIITLSSNLNDIAQMEDGTMQVKKKRLDYEFLTEVFRKYMHHPGFHILNIEVMIMPPSHSFIINADPDLLERMIQNLFDNASKYTTRNGRVILRCMTKDTENIISFFNTSPPIPEDKREFIFYKYGRMSETSSPYSKGLGLYFCKMVMQAHGGHIWVESDGQGNYFNLGFCLSGDLIPYKKENKELLSN